MPTKSKKLLTARVSGWLAEASTVKTGMRPLRADLSSIVHDAHIAHEQLEVILQLRRALLMLLPSDEEERNMRDVALAAAAPFLES